MSPSQSIHIRLFTAETLSVWIQETSFDELPDLPISRLRAQSQLINPMRRKEDVMLICAFHGKKLVGYLGCLPDRCKSTSIPLSFAWLSCIWVHPEARSIGLAEKMVREAISAYDGCICASDFTQAGEHLYRSKLNMGVWQTQEGLQLYRKLSLAQISQQRWHLPPFAGLIFGMGDWLWNKIFPFLMNAYSKQYNPPENGEIWEDCTELNAETKDFISELSGNSSEAERLNWIWGNPWLCGSSEEANEEQSRYYFSLVDSDWKRRLCRLRMNGEIQAIVMLQQRNGRLKLPILYYREGTEFRIRNRIIQQALEWDSGVVSCFQQDLLPYFRETVTPFFWQFPSERNILATPLLIEKCPLPNWQAGDGDAAFT